MVWFQKLKKENLQVASPVCRTNRL